MNVLRQDQEKVNDFLVNSHIEMLIKLDKIIELLEDMKKDNDGNKSQTDKK